MLMLAGLMGLMLVGATAFVGLDQADDGEIPGEAPDDSDLQAGFSSVLLDMLGAQIMTGTASDENIAGSEEDDQIGGYSGDDTISGEAGSDYLYGGAGHDLLDGQAGDDAVHGQDGNDTLAGHSGDDALFGHMGHDLMMGDLDDDTLHGGAGADALFGGSGDDALHGGLGADVLTGGDGQDTLFGSSGDDWMAGFAARLNAEEAEAGPQTDYLNGGPGADTLLADSADILTLGAGKDTAVIGDWIAEGPGVTMIDFTAGEDQLVLIHADATDDHLEVEIDADEVQTRVRLNGSVLAILPPGTAITLDDIVLVPESAASGLLSAA